MPESKIAELPLGEPERIKVVGTRQDLEAELARINRQIIGLLYKTHQIALALIEAPPPEKERGGEEFSAADHQYMISVVRPKIQAAKGRLKWTWAKLAAVVSGTEAYRAAKRSDGKSYRPLSGSTLSKIARGTYGWGETKTLKRARLEGLEKALDFLLS